MFRLMIGLGMVAALSAFGNPIQKEFDSNALGLLQAVHQYCPIPYIQAMRGATVTAARYLADRNVEHYFLTMTPSRGSKLSPTTLKMSIWHQTVPSTGRPEAPSVQCILEP